MGLLDDAIREHLDLKRRRGADPAEIERAEREALGPVRREPLASEAVEPERFELAGDALEHPALDEPHPALAAPHSDLDEAEPLELEAEPFELGAAEPDEEAGEPPAPRRHASGGRSLFGRLRRGNEPEHAEDERAPEPLGHCELPPLAGSAAHDEDPWDSEYGLEEAGDLLGPEPPRHEGPGTVAFRPPSEWEDEEEEPAVAGDPGGTHPDAPEPSVPPPHRAEPAPPAGPSPTRQPDPDETAEYDVGSGQREDPPPRRPPATPAEGADDQDEDVLEETPEFLQDTPDHDRLWFEQRPPRDFDFDG